MNLTRSQSRKTEYEVRLYEPVWFKDNKTCLFLMHNLAVVLAVTHTHTHTRRLDLTLILTRMESTKTPRACGQKVPWALHGLQTHTNESSYTNPHTIHHKTARTEASGENPGRHLVSMHLDVMIYTTNTHNCPSHLHMHNQWTHTKLYQRMYIMFIDDIKNHFLLPQKKISRLIRFGTTWRWSLFFFLGELSL